MSLLILLLNFFLALPAGVGAQTTPARPAYPPLPAAETPAHLPHNRWISIPAGEIELRNFAAAPYPDASRAHGFTYKGKFYSARAHYSDSTVGIFIPRDYRPGKRVNFIVHFHGWNNHVSRVLRHYRLPEQVEASRVNAILLVPQGPYDVSDSGDGKLAHVPGDFARLLRASARWLRQQGKIHTSRLGRVLISSHSGGYRGASQALKIGGLSSRVREVVLFDSAYGGLRAFSQWLAAGRRRRFASVFTDDTISGNVRLMADLEAAHIHFRVLRAAELESELARHVGRLRWGHNQAIFLYTPHLPHDFTPQGRGYFRLFLAASRLRG